MYSGMALVVLFVIINAITFAFFAKDKSLAVKEAKTRIPEKALLLLSFCYGSLGAILAMETLRHKTKSTPDNNKAPFTTGIPLAYIAQIAFIALWQPFHSNWIYLVCFGVYWLVCLIVVLTWKSSHARQKDSE